MASTALIGFMGAGKTTAAHSVGRGAVDVDETIESREGRPIAEIFAERGESAFRALEERVTLELLDDPAYEVVALGGGGVMSERVRTALGSRRVVWLSATWEDAWQRVRADCAERPLAQEPGCFKALHEEREPVYEALADAVVPASRSRTLPEILDALRELPSGARMIWAATSSADYPVYVGPGLITERRFWPQAVPGRRVVVTDYNAGRHYAEFMEPAFACVRIMPGEQSKTVAHAEIVWTEMVRHGVTRGDVVVALGGGVVGDLAGFCAATYQRGVRWVGAPTTLLAQVDSAYGGKTGVDLSEAKNYVGAFHQPSAVLCDPRTLSSLPREELSSGWAEVLKTGLVAGGALWGRARRRDYPGDVPDPGLIAACALTKLRIVERDERDAGARQLLNLGHTIAHAIESATGYARYRHGEAVGLGLLAELRLSGAGELRDELQELLLAHDLPVRLEGIEVDAVIHATARDKKRVQAGPVPFVLCEAPGQVRAGCAVSPGELRAAVRELVEP